MSVCMSVRARGLCEVFGQPNDDDFVLVVGVLVIVKAICSFCSCHTADRSSKLFVRPIIAVRVIVPTLTGHLEEQLAFGYCGHFEPFGAIIYDSINENAIFRLLHVSFYPRSRREGTASALLGSQ